MESRTLLLSSIFSAERESSDSIYATGIVILKKDYIHFATSQFCPTETLLAMPDLNFGVRIRVQSTLRATRHLFCSE